MRPSSHPFQVRNPLFIAGFLLLGALSGTSAAHAQGPADRYLVQPGDTLSGIAERFGADVSAIAVLNGLIDPDSLLSETYLLLPRSQPASAVEAPSSTSTAATTYEVAPGDTVSGLALRFGLSAEEIVAANRLESADQIVAGDQLRIEPAANTPKPPKAIVAEAPAPQPALAVAAKSAVADAALQANVRVPERAAEIAPKPAAAPVGPPASARVPDQIAAIAPQPMIAGGPSMQAAAARSPGPVQGRIVSVAAQYVGFPYVFGGDSPSGFDCSGFIQFVLSAAGSPFPRDLQAQYGSGAHPSRVELAPGDLVFFQDTYMDGLSHNGIYVGGGRFVHAVDEEKGVAVSNLNDTYWMDRWFGATRIA
jgi:cell wall-associated NlpC family hydrolase